MSIMEMKNLQCRIERGGGGVEWKRAKHLIAVSVSHHGLSLSTSRDSVAAAEHWISDIPLNLARQYDKDKECQFIYHSLGYKNYSDTIKLHQSNKNTET